MRLGHNGKEPVAMNETLEANFRASIEKVKEATAAANRAAELARHAGLLEEQAKHEHREARTAYLDQFYPGAA